MEINIKINITSARWSEDDGLECEDPEITIDHDLPALTDLLSELFRYNGVTNPYQLFNKIVEELSDIVAQQQIEDRADLEAFAKSDE